MGLLRIPPPSWIVFVNRAQSLAINDLLQNRPTVPTYPHALQELLILAETKRIVSSFTLDTVLTHTIRPSPDAVVNALPYLLDLPCYWVGNEEERTGLRSLRIFDW